jgi:hypothetical protein
MDAPNYLPIYLRDLVIRPFVYTTSVYLSVL